MAKGGKGNQKPSSPAPSSQKPAPSTPAQSQSHVQHLRAEYVGPLPPPGMLAEYNQITPGAAERIFAIFEEQAHHRMDLERTVIRSDVNRSWAGLVVGAILSTAVIGLGYVLVFNGHPVEGAAVVGIDVVGLVSCFVIGTSSRKNERAEKRRELEKRTEVS